MTSMKGLLFEPKVNLGQIIMILTFCGSIAGLAIAKERWCAQMEAKADSIAMRIDFQDKQLLELKKIVERNADSIGKLTENQSLVAQTLAAMRAVLNAKLEFGKE